MLKTLINNDTTDKESIHSYLPVYETILSPLRESAKRVLEIGIERGGSLKLWNDYFPNAEIMGFDIQEKVPDFLKNYPRIKTFKTNAYDTKLVSELIQKGYYFNVITDDGPHTLESMIFFAKYYSQLLAPGGVLIIEDIPSDTWIQAIYGCVPSHMKPYCKAYDLRQNKGRFDDILFIIQLPKEKERFPDLNYQEIFIER
jgi:cephalosporin hydroxylase